RSGRITLYQAVVDVEPVRVESEPRGRDLSAAKLGPAQVAPSRRVLVVADHARCSGAGPSTPTAYAGRRQSPWPSTSPT
ncbi:MAG: hypothetical protein M3170_00110, partial [Candidatus Dormibacteraeota bacterium]|nr:hypothetical protein [Candidatus Dormibacteraeota bacterium]